MAGFPKPRPEWVPMTAERFAAHSGNAGVRRGNCIDRQWLLRNISKGIGGVIELDWEWLKRVFLWNGVPPIEVIDGERLVNMLERLQLGVRPIKAFEIDDSFFDEFRQA